MSANPFLVAPTKSFAWPIEAERVEFRVRHDFALPNRIVLADPHVHRLIYGVTGAPDVRRLVRRRDPFASRRMATVARRSR